MPCKMLGRKAKHFLRLPSSVYFFAVPLLLCFVIWENKNSYTEENPYTQEDGKLVDLLDISNQWIKGLNKSQLQYKGKTLYHTLFCHIPFPTVATSILKLQ